jgi:DNA-binding transcriptional LysR family regulator
LGVSQSAVSNALARLRDILGDPLVVRRGAGLVATPRAVELAPVLKTLLAELRRALDRDTVFDPREATTHFTLACADSQQIHDVPKIAAMLSKKMPRATLSVVSIDFLLANDGLNSGSVDAAFAPRIDGQGLHYAHLYDEVGVAVVRRDHPRVKSRLTKTLFNSEPHVDVLIALGQGGHGRTGIEKVFRAAGLERRVVISVSSFTAAALIASKTDHVACLPRRVARTLAPLLGLRILPLPIPEAKLDVGLVWHERTNASVERRYFRDQVLAVLREE